MITGTEVALAYCAYLTTCGLVRVVVRQARGIGCVLSAVLDGDGKRAAKQLGATLVEPLNVAAEEVAIGVAEAATFVGITSLAPYQSRGYLRRQLTGGPLAKGGLMAAVHALDVEPSLARIQDQLVTDAVEKMEEQAAVVPPVAAAVPPVIAASAMLTTAQKARAFDGVVDVVQKQGVVPATDQEKADAVDAGLRIGAGIA